MKEYENKKLGFKFYIDEWTDDCDKIRIYDSNEEYCDYFEPETIIRLADEASIEPQRIIDDIAKDLAEKSTFKDFCASFLYEYETGTADDFAEIIRLYYDDDDEIKTATKAEQLEALKTNEMVNWFGNYIVYIV